MDYKNMIKNTTQRKNFIKQYLAKKSNIDNLKGDEI
jgi:hypothetical protein